MKKYSIYLNGTNFKLQEKDKIKRYGFYTTRYVKANNVQEAEKKAIHLLKKEVAKYFKRDKDEPAFMFIEEVEELESFGDVLVPGEGFSLYEEKRRSRRTIQMLIK